MEIQKKYTQNEIDSAIAIQQKIQKRKFNRKQLDKNNINIAHVIRLTPRNKPSFWSQRKTNVLSEKYTESKLKTNATKVDEKQMAQNPLELVKMVQDPFFSNNFQGISQVYVPITEKLDFNIQVGIQTMNMNPNYYLSPYLVYQAENGFLYQAGVKFDYFRHFNAGFQKQISQNWRINGTGSVGYLPRNPQLQHQYIGKLNAQFKDNYNLYSRVKNNGTYQGGFSYQGIAKIRQLNFKYFTLCELSKNKSTKQEIFPEAQVGISKNFSQIGYKLKIYQALSHFMFKTKAEIQININKLAKILVDLEFVGQDYTIFLGFQQCNFSLSLPIFTYRMEKIKDVAITLALSGGIILGTYKLQKYLSEKLNPQKNRNNSSENATQIQQQYQEEQLDTQEENRKAQLQIISDKANQKFEYEKQAPHGLRIVEAYYGIASEIEILKQQKENRAIYLLQNKNKMQNVIDVTIPLRFNVFKSQLQLYGKDKSKLIGFKTIKPQDNKENVLLIIYQRNDQQGLLSEEQQKQFHSLYFRESEQVIL